MRLWKLALLILLGIAITFGGTSCSQEGGSSDEVVLNSYALDGLPPHQRRQIRSAIDRLLDDRGAASLLDDGTLAVTAPRSLQSGIRQTIESASASKGSGGPVPARSVTISCWAVIARPNPEFTVPPLPERVLEALDEVVLRTGEMEFALLASARMTSTEGGQQATILGHKMTIAQRVISIDETAAIAELKFDIAGNNALETRVRLEPDQIVVLGQTGYAPPGRRSGNQPMVWELPEGWSIDDAPTLYLIVTSDRS